MRGLMRTSYAASYAQFEACLMHGLMRSLMPNKDGWRRSLYVACRFVFALEDIHIYISMDMHIYIEREMGIHKYHAESYAVTEVLCMSYAEPYAVLCGASTGLRAKCFLFIVFFCCSFCFLLFSSLFCYMFLIFLFSLLFGIWFSVF